MQARNRKLKANIALFLLLAVAARSLVAAGWMLATPTHGDFGLPSLVICPQQSPAVATWLDEISLEHAHHHAPSTSSDTAELSVLDPSCGLWANSALAVAAAQSSTPFVNIARTSGPVLRKLFYRQLYLHAHRARAPPISSNA